MRARYDQLKASIDESKANTLHEWLTEEFGDKAGEGPGPDIQARATAVIDSAKMTKTRVAMVCHAGIE